jgi:hypothetical protein
MALSAEEKKALEEHYKGRDLYDPSKEPGQDPPSFSAGGTCEAPGYAEGGDVPGIDLGEPLPFEASDFSGPSLSAATDTVKAPISAPPAVPNLRVDPLSLNPVPKAASVPLPAAQGAQGAPLTPPPASLPPQNAPTASQGGRNGLSEDEFSQLLKVLQPSAGQRFGQGAMSALAGLADAIETGVARTNGSNFQKNLTEDRQKQKENLREALRAKYETGFKGRELGLAEKRAGEEERHNLEGENETRAARQLTQQAQDLAMKQHGAQLGLEQNKLEAEENKNALEQAEKTGGIWNKLKGAVGLGIPGPNPATLARAQGQGKTASASSGPYGPTVVRNGKLYQWSPVSQQYHPAQ